MALQTQQRLVEELDLIPLIAKETYQQMDLFFQTDPSLVNERYRRLHIVFGNLFRTAEGIHTPELDAARILAKGIVKSPNTTDPAIKMAREDYESFEKIYS
jgi:hypothetical protein